jgi:hemerythrin-like metal-binding protein
MYGPIAADMSDMFEWSPAYSVGIGSIDAQHQSLLAIGRELCNAMSTGQSKAVTSNTLDRLIQCTTMHFAHEERLMHTRGYPDLAAHKAEHDALAAKAVQFQADFKAGRETMSIEVLNLLQDLLVGHFQGSDRKYSLFFRKKAVA